MSINQLRQWTVVFAFHVIRLPGADLGIFSMCDRSDRTGAPCTKESIYRPENGQQHDISWHQRASLIFMSCVATFKIHLMLWHGCAKSEISEFRKPHLKHKSDNGSKMRTVVMLNS